jgi:hypothetical protein
VQVQAHSSPPVDWTAIKSAIQALEVQRLIHIEVKQADSEETAQAGGIPA